MPAKRTDRPQVILNMLAGRHEGVTVSDVMTATGDKMAATRNALFVMSTQGLVYCARHGATARWVLPEYSQQALQFVRAARPTTPPRKKAMPKPCEISDCCNVRYGHGYCYKHYKRWKKHGDPMAALRRYSNGHKTTRAETAERLERIVAILKFEPQGHRYADLAKRFGLTDDAMRKTLGRLSKEGLVVPVRHGHISLWTVPELAASVADRLVALPGPKPRVTKPYEADGYEDPILVVQRSLRPASECAPLVVRAPRSVFELASH